MLRERIGLIPRYNWDYGLTDLGKALSAAFQPPSDGERAFEAVFGRQPLFTASGRASLYAILKSLNLPGGSLVGVPLFCCPVVFDAVRQAGLRPRFIDISLEDYTLSAQDLQKKIRTLSAVVVVHMFGHPADLDSIAAVSGDLPLIEDCAQSLYSRYKGRETGFQSTASFFSFRSGKYISAGEGSAIFTSQPALREALETIVGAFPTLSVFEEIAHCTSTYIKSTLYHRPWYGTIGFPIGTRIDRKLNLTAKSGFHLSRVARTDLAVIMDRLNGFAAKVKSQRENALYLLEALKTADFHLPSERTDCSSNFYQFALRFEDSPQRDLMADYLFAHGIDTAKYLDEVLDLAREEHGYSGDCPNAERASKTVLVVPNHYTLARKDLDHIAHHLKQGNRVLHS